MNWVCCILLLSSVFAEVFSKDSSEGSAGASFSDDEDIFEHDYSEGGREGIEGSGESSSDDEDCGENGCRKSEKIQGTASKPDRRLCFVII